MGGPLELRYREPVEAVHAWSSGLRHGVVALPGDVTAAVGERVEVHVLMLFAHRRFKLAGEVTELEGGHPAIVLDYLPQDLHVLVQELAGDEEPLSSEHASTSDSLEAFEISTDSADELLVGASLSEDDFLADAAPPSFDLSNVRRVWARPHDRSVEGFTLPDGSGRVLPAPPRFSGVMGRKGWSPVLLLVLRDHLTGVLVVNGGNAQCWVYCRNGYPVHVVRTPSRGEDSFQHHAIRHDLLAPEVAAPGKHLAEVTGRSFMSVVMRLDLLDEASVVRLREEVVTHALRDALTEVRGEYDFFAEPELEYLFRDTPAPVVRTLVRWAIEQQGGLTEESALELVARHGADHVYLTPLGLETLKHMGLSEFQVRVLHNMAVADQTLAQVIFDEEGREKQVIQLLFGLLTLGLVDSGEPTIGPVRDRLSAERRLRAYSGRIGLDFFSLVGCHWTDVPGDIEQGLAEAQEILANAPPAVDEPDDLDDLRQRLGDVLNAAREILQDPVARRRYRAQLVSEREAQHGTAVLHRQGAVALQMGRRDEARARFEMALETDPGGSDAERRTEKIRRALDALGAPDKEE